MPATGSDVNDVTYDEGHQAGGGSLHYWTEDHMATDGVRRVRPRWTGGVAALVLSCLVTVSCSASGGQEQGEPAKAKEKQGPFYCDAVGDGTPLGGHGNGSHVASAYEGKQKGELNADDCAELGRQLEQANASGEGLQTRGAAEAAGWTELAQYIPGLGTHHVMGRFRDALSAPLDLAKPAFLIYGGLDADAPLVGFSYIAPGSSDPPEAFAGGNDWWHLHQKLCLSSNNDILAGAEEIPDDECAALGGRQIDLGKGIWLLHLWSVPDYEMKLDIFASGHPCLGETGPLPDDDPCWDHVDRHPAEGLPPDHTDVDDGHSHDADETDDETES
jgi:hypothetical protein